MRVGRAGMQLPEDGLCMVSTRVGAASAAVLVVCQLADCASCLAALVCNADFE